MSGGSLSPARPGASRAGPLAPASAASRVSAVVLFATLTAVAARFAAALPGTSVPLTLQVAAVLLAGFLLGPRLGAASQALYVAGGVGGLPVFALGGGPAYLLGPTGGYLLAYPVAAAAAGAIAWGGAGKGNPGAGRLAAAAVAGLALIHAGGAAWLATAVGPADAVRVGVLPFLAGDALKAGLAVLVAARLTGPARDFFRSA